ncbi:MAG: Lrp/AsnC family transcriptional regulator [Euryarchaeota archaeon]|nr:Lrp/AsnC family transcriptional regulator [Euryarchaeota archaeon]
MLTEKQLAILRTLYQGSRSIKVHTTRRHQEELAEELGITRQALSAHLKALKEAGLIRTGRGFVDLTDRALKEIGKMGEEAFVLLKVEPNRREEVFQALKGLPHQRLYRVTGDIDIMAVVDVEALNGFLKEAARIKGITSTSSHVVVEMHQEGV